MSIECTELESDLQTLEQLKAGELNGIKRLSLSANLTEFPTEIYSLADSLEILDLSNNQLMTLPQDLPKLHRLKVIFLSNNPIEIFPSILALCPNLEMIGFKSCRLKHIAEDALPPKLRWLILTDNQLTLLPNAIGQCPRLEKLALAGNQLAALPETLKHCENLALIRISANQLTHLPDWLLALPKLAWLAFSGNPFCATADLTALEHSKFHSQDFECDELLGQGASGLIYRARWQKNTAHTQEDFAVKIFKGQLTSDGYPQDELQTSLKIPNHPNWIEVLGHFDNHSSENPQTGLLMKLIPSDYKNLGLPPSLETCSRDTFAPELQLNQTTTLKILQAVSSAMAHLHQHEISHGDLYAHNILINDNADLLMGDFGAASQYHELSNPQKQQIQHLELRAFAYLIDDLMTVSLAPNSKVSETMVTKLRQLQNDCAKANLSNPLTFEKVHQTLQQFSI
ncbi:leucine-rich repeat-containing protein kinase family protein [Thiosulfativibrio zosterae]|uniref:leucine-rich repeat-containing protein kinase family protein n=1 Tax=Thiosulfativibrio zosterae TaxID=2675053 RepID=UPI001A9C0BA9|nr:leucine-rich repeat-containing protein kinase family protein [Thiosulfativibrio zosterae]